MFFMQLQGEYAQDQGIECLKVGIGRFLVTHSSPELLLGIQFRVVLGNVMNSEPSVSGKKFCDPISLVPLGLIYPKFYDDMEVSRKDMSEHSQKPIRIAFRLAQHAVPSLDWINPAEDVESLMVLTPGPHKGLHPLLCPYSSQVQNS
jgi:hypothetical protein